MVLGAGEPLRIAKPDAPESESDRSEKEAGPSGGPTVSQSTLSQVVAVENSIGDALVNSPEERTISAGMGSLSTCNENESGDGIPLSDIQWPESQHRYRSLFLHNNVDISMAPVNLQNWHQLKAEEDMSRPHWKVSQRHWIGRFRSWLRFSRFSGP